MKLSIYVATRNGSTRNPAGAFAQLLERLRELGDELVVAVDYTTTDDTFDVAKKFTQNVGHFAHDPMWAEMRTQSFRRCAGDWVFALDDDDRLSAGWSRAVLEQLMSSRPTTHYWVPSRYFVNDEGFYLSVAPWIGHSSVQLYRNIESIASIPTTLHYQLAVAGEPAYLAGLYIDAMDFVWHSREYREEKVRSYDEAHDEALTQFNQARFYLYEDYYFETRRADDAAMPAIMSPFKQRYESGVHVQLLDCPKKMTAAQTYWITVRIVNATDRPLLPQSEFIRWGTLAIAYSWAPVVDAGSGIRSPFPARIMPGHEHDALVKVTAPAGAGTYELKMDVLEENRSMRAVRCEARAVEVAPLVWPPQIGDSANG